MDFFGKIVEERIREAQRAGKFDGLAGQGRKLDIEDDSHIPEDLRMAYRILRNADCLPPEIDLRKDILRLRDLVAAAGDDPGRDALVREANLKILKLNMMRPTRLDLETAELMVRRRSRSVSGGPITEDPK